MRDLRVVEGETLNIVEEFLDEWDSPLLPAEGYTGPIVTLYDTDKSIIQEVTAVPALDPGTWSADIGVPVFNLEDEKNFVVVWVFTDEDLNTHRVKHTVTVEPSSINRDADIVVLIKSTGTPKYSVSLPFVYSPATSDEVTFSLILNNVTLMDELSITDASVDIKIGTTRTEASIPNTVIPISLEPHLLTVTHKDGLSARTRMYTYKIWPVKPQVLVAASLVEDHINKAKLENVIPELRYTQSDLVQYLYRGLSLFNQFPPRTTAFNGMNMQGIILDSWVTCACYYALGAQLQAEGALAFDFSGQSVNLNVDRSPAIEAALGRIESQFDNVKANKKLLAKANLVSGDGHEGGGYISTATAQGTLGISNAPTSKYAISSRPPRIRRR